MAAALTSDPKGLPYTQARAGLSAELLPALVEWQEHERGTAAALHVPAGRRLELPVTS